MKTIKITELKPGISFTKPVYIDKNNLFVSEGEVITEEHINRLKRWGIKEVFTVGDPVAAQDEKGESSQEVFTSYLKERHINDVKNISRLNQYLDNSEKLLKEIYENAMDKKTPPASLINDLRNRVEELIDVLSEAPNVIIAMPYKFVSQDYPEYIYGHALRATIYSLVLGKALKYSRGKLIELGMGTMLIDIGMMMIPVSILKKEGPLSEEEFKYIKAHTIFGYKYIFENLRLKNKIAIIALQHHENFDGKGYPKRLKGKDIDEYARIACIADNYASLCEERTYREALSPYNAMKELLSLGMSKFDPIFLKTFLNRLSMYPIGTLVKLGDGRIGIVISSNSDKPLRPNIRILKDQFNEDPKDIEIVDLSNNPDIYIQSALRQKDVDFNVLDLL